MLDGLEVEAKPGDYSGRELIWLHLLARHGPVIITIADDHGLGLSSWGEVDGLTDRGRWAGDGGVKTVLLRGGHLQIEEFGALLDRGLDLDGHFSLISTAWGLRVRLTLHLGRVSSILLDDLIEDVLLAIRGPFVLDGLLELDGVLDHRDSIEHVAEEAIEIQVFIISETDQLEPVFIGHESDLNGESDERLSDSVEDGDPQRPFADDHDAGLAGLHSAVTDVDLGTEDVGAILGVPGHEQEKAVSTNGIGDRVDPLLITIRRARRNGAIGRLRSGLVGVGSLVSGMSSRLLRGPIDPQGGGQVASQRDLRERLSRCQEKGLRDLKNRLDRSQARSPGNLRDLRGRKNKLARRDTRSPRDRPNEATVTGRLAVAVWHWDCLTLTTDVTDGTVCGGRTCTLVRGRRSRSGSRSVGLVTRRSRTVSAPGNGRRTSANGGSSMSELLTVTLTTKEISEVLHVATRDGFWVCDKSVKLLCEGNDGCCLLFQAAVAGLAEA